MALGDPPPKQTAAAGIVTHDDGASVVASNTFSADGPGAGYSSKAP